MPCASTFKSNLFKIEQLQLIANQKQTLISNAANKAGMYGDRIKRENILYNYICHMELKVQL